MNDTQQQPELIETEIAKIVTGGAGMGACGEGKAFVPLTAPGDRVRARVTQRKRGFVTAELVELLAPGPDRVAPACPHFGACGGCDLQQLAGPAQRAAKREIVADCFRRLGSLDVAALIEGPEPAGPELGYRNRIRLHAEATGRLGLLRRGSQVVVPIDACPQMPPEFNATILPWLRTLPPVEQMIVRLDGAGGFLVSLFGLPNRLRVLKQQLRELADGQPPLHGCAGILYNNLPAWGRDHLLLKVAGHTFRVGANAFFQSNLAEAEAVVATARAWLGEARPVDAGAAASAGSAASTGAAASAGAAPSGLLVDLFAGVGLFGVGLADRFARVIAVESDPHAVRDARNNAGHVKALAGRYAAIESDVAKALGDWTLGRAPRGAGEAQAPASRGRARAGEGSPAGSAPSIGASDAASSLVPSPEEWREACVVVDPPRVGLGEAVTTNLEKLAPRDILYLSCDPATLARDAAALTRAGYTLRRLRVFDMFPQTGHVEALAHLQRG
jgi:tRNA/tmRNA/rRNA uracil-C5-methylase (TrmA/RlmC/RlmD family)